MPDGIPKICSDKSGVGCVEMSKTIKISILH